MDIYMDIFKLTFLPSAKLKVGGLSTALDVMSTVIVAANNSVNATATDIVSLMVTLFKIGSD